jgi:hypothetical protein
MTLKMELEERQDSASTQVSKKEFPRTGERQRDLYASPAPRTASMAVEPYSAKQIYFKVCVYGILLAGGLWATINVLSWFWHKLL